MEINSKKIDELYKEWSGEHHTTNSNKPIHDSAECTDFAEYCLKYAVSDGKMIPTRESNCNIPLVSNNEVAVCQHGYYHVEELPVVVCTDCGEILGRQTDC